MALAVSAAAFGISARRITAAQAPEPSASTGRFDVASVKPHRAADDVMFALYFHEGGRFTATGTVRMLIRTAYQLQESQLAGGPGWIDSDLFDIVAKAEDAAATPEVMRLMLRQLLADRFAVRMRTESRDMPIYALALARRESTRSPRVVPAPVDCERTTCGVRVAPGRLTASGMTMTELATNISMWVDRIVAERLVTSGSCRSHPRASS